MSKTPPNTASVAYLSQGGKLDAPSAARNVDAICDLLRDVAPTKGTALEIASGTGQHVVRFAALLPALHWQPSEIDPARRASIDAYTAESGQTNIAPAIALNACISNWSNAQSQKNLIVLVNLLHLISDDATRVLISEVAQALSKGGRLIIYGPFMRGDELTSDGDIAFHASLIAQDPLIGYKDDFDMMDLIQSVGLDMVDAIEMPANNLALVAQKPAF